MALLNSTRLPESPAESRTVWTKVEFSACRSMDTATLAGPFSTIRTFAGPLTIVRGARCSSSKSMFQAGQRLGLSFEIARCIGEESN